MWTCSDGALKSHGEEPLPSSYRPRSAAAAIEHASLWFAEQLSRFADPDWSSKAQGVTALSLTYVPCL